MAETAILEIVELDDGEIVLRSAEHEGEPLVRIHFSQEAADLLRRSRFEVAREMIDHAITRTQLWEGEAGPEDATLDGTLH